MPSLVSDLRASPGPRERALGAVGTGGLRLRRLHDRASPARGGRFPAFTQEVAEIVRFVGRHGAAVIARGAGTSLAGGCLPLRPSAAADGARVVLMLSRMNRILEIDLRNRMAVVEAGVQQPAAHPGPGRHRLPFRPRSVEPRRQHASAATWPPTPAARTRSSTA